MLLTAKDSSGNTTTKSATVTVVDTVPPTVITQNFTLELDENGVGTIKPSDIDNGTNDATGIASLTLDITFFDCSNIGNNTVTLTATDNNNNSSSLTATVSVADVTAPVITASIDSRYYKGKVKKGEYYTDLCAVIHPKGVIEIQYPDGFKIILKLLVVIKRLPKNYLLKNNKYINYF